MIGFPPWPESGYLARVARLPVAHQDVLDVSLAVQQTENVRVYEDLADVALALPPALAVRLVPKVSEALALSYLARMPDKLGNLVARLADGGEFEGALSLARSLLDIPGDLHS